jgi:peptidoglycan hydrolase CwlO-like protein
VNKEIQEMKEITSKVTEIEKGVTYLSNQYDDKQKQIAETKNTVKDINQSLSTGRTPRS